MLRGPRLFAPLVAAFALAGCANGCAEERPYTPYAVEAGEALFAKDGGDFEDEETRNAELLVGDAEGSRGVPTKPDAPDARSFVLDGLELVAAEGESFVMGLAADLDGDGAKDAVAWVASGAREGRLLFYRGNGASSLSAPKELARLAGIFPDACEAEVSLEQVGTTTVSVKATAHCAEPPPTGATSRWLAVLSPAAEPPLRQAITMRQPPPGEDLSVTVDAADRDGDGRDDLAVRFGLEGGPAPFEAAGRVTAELRWFDRPAGLSRDSNEPEASLRPHATRQMVRAERKKEAASVLSGTRQVFRLYTMLCEEAGAPLVSFATGPLRCGTSRALEDALLAQVRAASTMGDPVRALAAIERFSDWPTAHTSGRRKEADRIARKLAPIAEAGPLRVLAAIPVPMSGASWSPLAFDDAGALLVLTHEGVVKATVLGEEWLSEEEEPWSLAVSSPDGRTRWLSSFDPCDGLAYRLRLVGLEGVVNEPILPLLTPASGRNRCSAQVPMAMLGVSRGRLEAMIAGEPWSLGLENGAVEARALASGAIGAGERARGAARSPDGKALAIGMRGGVLVRAEGKWRLWKFEGEGEAVFEGCTVANGGRAVACLRGGKVVVGVAAEGGGG